MLIPRKDKDGNEIPDAPPKVTVVSKLTLLPKDLAGELYYLCCVAWGCVHVDVVLHVFTYCLVRQQQCH